MLTNVLFRNTVLRDFAAEPLRYFAELTIWDYESYAFGLSTAHKYSCHDNDDFRRRMRLARVGHVVYVFVPPLDTPNDTRASKNVM